MTVSLTTIFALSSATGKAGVSVIRISGSETKHCVESFCRQIPKPRYASLQNISDPVTQEVIDQGLVLWFPAPHSFTGEDCAEFQIHGGTAVVSKMLFTLGQFANLRMAVAGEFARRAFDNGKMDLTQIEGLADLINADTEIQRQQAVQQSSGELGKLYESWRYQLIQVMTLLTAAIDFSDEEDIAEDILQSVKPKIKALQSEITAHLHDGQRGEILREGYQVVLAGVPNVGKSSLLNILARRDAAIVSDEAGTTRDIIQVSLDLDGYPIIIMDTAGLRSTQSKVEKEGIRRTIATAKEAHLIIWLVDASDPNLDMPEEIRSHPNLLIVKNKTDLIVQSEDQDGTADNMVDVSLSIKNSVGLSQLIKKISDNAKQHIGHEGDLVITRQRYRSDLENALHQIHVFLDHPIDDTELRAEDLRLAANAIGRITGHIDVEDLLDVLFSEFCIGK